MAEKTAAPKRLTAKDTKQEMLAAYQDVLRQLEEKRQAESRPEAKVEQRVTAEAVKVADELSNEGVVKQIGDLRASIGRLLSQASDRLEEQVGRYAQIARAIAFKEKELSEIYEIQKAALSLGALIQAQHEKREQFELEIAEEREELTREIEETRAQWEQERAGHEAAVKERDAAEARRRKREDEEYRYAFAREQQLARDQFADEKGKMERELARRKVETEQQLGERERAVAEREAELARLRQQVEAFPAQLDAAVARAVKDATARAQSEAAAREELLKRDFAGERNVLTTQIASLQQSVKEQSAQLAKLSQQSEKAYGQMQDIAVKAIEGSSNFKSWAGMQQTFADPARKQPAER
jgi:hypothetical protein